MRRMVTQEQLNSLGGSKLYKHTVTFGIDVGEEEPWIVTAIFVTNDGDSLLGQEVYEFNDFISGWLKMGEGESAYQTSILAKLTYDSNYLYYNVENSSIETLSIDLSATFLSDNVEEL